MNELITSDYLLIFAIALVVFLALDMLWLGWVAKDIYQEKLKKFLSPKPNWAVASLFYVLFIIGLIYFVIGPAVEEESLGKAMVSGALYGLFMYATYDLTNLATLKNWPVKITVIDLFWGTFLSFAVAVLTYNIYLFITA